MIELPYFPSQFAHHIRIAPRRPESAEGPTVVFGFVRPLHSPFRAISPTMNHSLHKNDISDTLAPIAQLCDRPFELQVVGLVFLGFPVRRAAMLASSNGPAHSSAVFMNFNLISIIILGQPRWRGMWCLCWIRRHPGVYGATTHALPSAWPGRCSTCKISQVSYTTLIADSSLKPMHRLRHGPAAAHRSPATRQWRKVMRRCGTSHDFTCTEQPKQASRLAARSPTPEELALCFPCRHRGRTAGHGPVLSHGIIDGIHCRRLIRLFSWTEPSRCRAASRQRIYLHQSCGEYVPSSLAGSHIGQAIPLPAAERRGRGAAGRHRRLGRSASFHVRVHEANFVLYIRRAFALGPPLRCHAQHAGPCP